MSEFVTTVYKVKYSLERPNYESPVTDGDLVKCFVRKNQRPRLDSNHRPHKHGTNELHYNTAVLIYQQLPELLGFYDSNGFIMKQASVYRTYVLDSGYRISSTTPRPPSCPRHPSATRGPRRGGEHSGGNPRV